MSARHQGVAQAIRRLAYHIDQPEGEDGPHVVFAVAIDGTPQARVYVCQSDDRMIPIADLGRGRGRGDSMPWSMVDLEDAARFLGIVQREFWIASRTGRPDEVGQLAEKRAADAIQRGRDHDLTQVLEAAAYDADHPHACPSCNKRFRTERGLAMHSSRARWCRPCFVCGAVERQGGSIIGGKRVCPSLDCHATARASS